VIHFTMVYWRGEQFWIGKPLAHPEVMTQGETIEALEEHLRDASHLLILDEVPADAQVKALDV
jgi:predicted RNase H-like HicB family nuclease